MALSKTRILQGMRCTKSLYLQIHSPKLAAPADPSLQALFDQGHEVGLEAQKRFPGGVTIQAKPYELERAARETERAISGGALAIFEATFRHDDVWVRADLLARDRVGAPWRLIEVKSSASLKEEHLVDLAIQAWVIRGAGLELESAAVWHLNSACVHPNLEKLFTEVDLSAPALELAAGIPAQLSKLRAGLAGASAPAVDIGPYCDAPHECTFKAHCFAEKGVPELSVFDLPSIGPKAWTFYQQGIVELTDPRIPREGLKPAQERMIEAARTGERFIDRERIAAELASWRWPLHYLDFETLAPAIPKFPGMRPYQNFPFQFSCHYQRELGGALVHLEYLHPSANDPRRAVAEKLLESIAPGPEGGSVVAYYKTFESNCIDGLAELFPDLRADLLSIRDRLVDPLPIFRAAVYDPGFRGSFSIKHVAPSLIGAHLSYENLLVRDGQAAQQAYAELLAPTTSPARREQLRAGLIEYCKQDTLSLVLLVEWLYRQSAAPGTAVPAGE